MLKMKFILIIIGLVLVPSCDQKSSIQLEINDYFIVELDDNIIYEKFSVDGAKGIDLKSSYENVRVHEIVYERRDRELKEHVKLFPIETIKKHNYTLLTNEPYKTDVLKGTYTHYRDNVSTYYLWSLYHKNRYLLVIKVTNDPKKSDRKQVEALLDKIKIK